MEINELFAKDLSAIARIDAVQKILEVVCRTTGLGFSAVARVTETHWVACAVRDEIAFGLQPGGELKIETTICDEIRDSGRAVVIDHASQELAFCNHPTPKLYGFESYISVPIRLPNGQFFGTLCAIDPRPARVNTPATIGMFNLFADLIAQHLDTQQRMDESEAALLDEREASQLREQFIAVLGHDLRNPLTAIASGADVLHLLPHTPKAGELITLIRQSSRRMVGLINDVLDFARGRLGGGLSVERRVDPTLQRTLDHVITELQAGSPGREIRRSILLGAPVRCDAARVGQMLSNLLANALVHGDPAGPVSVDARSDVDTFELSVSNHGTAIPAHIITRLFEPFARGSAKPGQQGLGLGLYIASEIARAHEGTLSVTSTDAQTRFTFSMPQRPPTADAR